MRQFNKRTVLKWALIGLCMAPAPGQADDWPQWLGPERNAIWKETGIIDKFPAKGPALRWKSSLGGGYSGPVSYTHLTLPTKA